MLAESARACTVTKETALIEPGHGRGESACNCVPEIAPSHPQSMPLARFTAGIQARS